MNYKLFSQTPALRESLLIFLQYPLVKIKLVTTRSHGQPFSAFHERRNRVVIAGKQLGTLLATRDGHNYRLEPGAQNARNSLKIQYLPDLPRGDVAEGILVVHL